MRRALILFVVTILVVSPHAGFTQNAHADTSFISREFDNGFYHAVFIEKNIQSGYFNSIADFAWNGDDSISYTQSLKYLFKDDVAVKMTHTKLPATLPKQWCELHYFKGGRYLYAPSDWGNNYRASINDSTYIQYNMDGPFGTLLDSCVVIDANTFVLYVHGASSILSSVKIYVIDWKKHIAVFENHLYSGFFYYNLMVGSENVREFPIIVNYCRDRKQTEFQFDQPDFGALINDMH